MTAAEWLQARAPQPPELLASRIQLLVGSAPSTDTEPASALASVAEHALSELLDRGDHSRAIAIDLLAIDALVTYACEAAAEERDAPALVVWCSDFASRLAAVRSRGLSSG